MPASAWPKWRLTIEIPMSVDDERRDRLATAVADAAFKWDADENWADTGHYGWDIDVSGGPADEGANITVLRRAATFGSIGDQYQAMQYILYPDLYKPPVLFDPTPPTLRSVLRGKWVKVWGWTFHVMKFKTLFPYKKGGMKRP